MHMLSFKLILNLFIFSLLSRFLRIQTQAIDVQKINPINEFHKNAIMDIRCDPSRSRYKDKRKGDPPLYPYTGFKIAYSISREFPLSLNLNYKNVNNDDNHKSLFEKMKTTHKVHLHYCTRGFLIFDATYNMPVKDQEGMIGNNDDHGNNLITKAFEETIWENPICHFVTKTNNNRQQNFKIQKKQKQKQKVCYKISRSKEFLRNIHSNNYSNIWEKYSYSNLMKIKPKSLMSKSIGVIFNCYNNNTFNNNKRNLDDIDFNLCKNKTSLINPIGPLFIDKIKTRYYIFNSKEFTEYIPIIYTPDKTEFKKFYKNNNWSFGTVINENYNFNDIYNPSSSSKKFKENIFNSNKFREIIRKYNLINDNNQDHFNYKNKLKIYMDQISKYLIVFKDLSIFKDFVVDFDEKNGGSIQIWKDELEDMFHDWI